MAKGSAYRLHQIQKLKDSNRAVIRRCASIEINDLIQLNLDSAKLNTVQEILN